jgi:hypothetical protein
MPLRPPDCWCASEPPRGSPRRADASPPPARWSTGPDPGRAPPPPHPDLHRLDRRDRHQHPGQAAVELHPSSRGSPTRRSPPRDHLDPPPRVSPARSLIDPADDLRPTNRSNTRPPTGPPPRWGTAARPPGNGHAAERDDVAPDLVPNSSSSRQASAPARPTPWSPGARPPGCRGRQPVMPSTPASRHSTQAGPETRRRRSRRLAGLVGHDPSQLAQSRLGMSMATGGQGLPGRTPASHSIMVALDIRASAVAPIRRSRSQSTHSLERGGRTATLDHGDERPCDSPAVLKQSACAPGAG